MNLNILIGVILVFGLFGIIGAISSDITDEVREDQITNAFHCGLNSTNGTGGTLLYDHCPHSYNISTNALSAQQELSSWTPTIALAVAAGIVITAVLGFLAFRKFS